MHTNQEKIAQLVLSSIDQLALPKSDDLLVAPIERRPRYWLASLFINVLASLESSVEVDTFQQVEVYNNGSPDPAYVRAYKKPDATGVVSHVVGNEETISRLARWDGSNPIRVTGDEPWLAQLENFINLSQIFANHQPHYLIRMCSFVIDRIGQIENQTLGTLKAKRFAYAINRVMTGEFAGKPGDHFTHITRPNEQEPIEDIDGYGVVVTNSYTYARRNRHYNWQPLGKLLTSRVQSRNDSEI